VEHSSVSLWTVGTNLFNIGTKVDQTCQDAALHTSVARPIVNHARRFSIYHGYHKGYPVPVPPLEVLPNKR